MVVLMRIQPVRGVWTSKANCVGTFPRESTCEEVLALDKACTQGLFLIYKS